jgi:hypothetical protein
MFLVKHVWKFFVIVAMLIAECTSKNKESAGVYHTVPTPRRRVILKKLIVVQ